jgi:ribosomal protein S6
MLQSSHMLATIADEKGATQDSLNTGEAVVYEVGYHLLPTIEDAEVEGIVSRFREVITKAEGSLIAEGAPQKIALAYPMAVWGNGVWTKNNNAHFGWIKFEMVPEKVSAVDQCFKEDKAVLRFMVTKTVKEDTRATVRQFVMREVKRSDSIKSTVRKVTPEVKEKVSDKKLDEVIEGLIAEE